MRGLTSCLTMLGTFTLAVSVAAAPAVADDIVGTAGDDELVGTRGDDVVLARAGDDRLDGKAGDDALYGGKGDDVIRGGYGHDLLRGGAGADYLGEYDHGRDEYHAGRGADVVFMHEDRRVDTIRCGPGRDTIIFEFERSPLDRHAGCERTFLIGTLLDDDLTGTRLPDTVKGLAGDDELFGRAGRDRLLGGRGEDHLVGGEGRDRMYGRFGADVLYGGRGADSLVGGTGADVLRGADGADYLAASGPRVRLYGGPGSDTVQAFSSDRGTDFFHCGRGKDLLVYDAAVDPRDKVTGCERVVPNGGEG